MYLPSISQLHRGGALPEYTDIANVRCCAEPLYSAPVSVGGRAAAGAHLRANTGRGHSPRGAHRHTRSERRLPPQRPVRPPAPARSSIISRLRDPSPAAEGRPAEVAPSIPCAAEGGTRSHRSGRQVALRRLSHKPPLPASSAPHCRAPPAGSGAARASRRTPLPSHVTRSHQRGSGQRPSRATSHRPEGAPPAVPPAGRRRTRTGPLRPVGPQQPAHKNTSKQPASSDGKRAPARARRRQPTQDLTESGTEAARG